MNTHLEKMRLCKHESIALFPDYASSACQCAECGIVFGDPSLSFPNLPKSLIVMIDGWNWLWELANDHLENINREHFEDVYLTMGTTLAEQVSQFYPCILGVDRDNLLDYEIP